MNVVLQRQRLGKPSASAAFPDQDEQQDILSSRPSFTATAASGSGVKLPTAIIHTTEGLGQ